MSRASASRHPERGSAAGVVAVLLLALVLTLAAYVAWGLLLTPHLVSVAPNPAAEKTAVLLQGSRFAPYPGGNIVLFGDQTGKVLRSGPTELEVRVPELGLPAGRQARAARHHIVLGMDFEPQPIRGRGERLGVVRGLESKPGGWRGGHGSSPFSSSFP